MLRTAVVLSGVLVGLPIHADNRRAVGKGWSVDAPVKELTDYEGGIDTQVVHNGHASAFLRAVVANPKEHVVIWQGIDPTRYRGQRLRVGAWVRTQDVSVAAGAFMKIIGSDPKTSLAYDRHDLSGSHGWTRQEMVLDVADDAKTIWFGLGLEGKGTAWIDSVTWEVVDASVPTTDWIRRLPAPDAPQDLDFES